MTEQQMIEQLTEDVKSLPEKEQAMVLAYAGGILAARKAQALRQPEQNEQSA